MVVSISKASILKDTWETFYDRLNTDVTSVTIDSGPIFTIGSNGHTSSFPDNTIDNKESYPVMVINPVNTEWESFTFTKKWVNGSIELEIYVTNSEAADMFLDEMIESIETYRDTLWENKMYFVDLNSTDSESVMRNGFKVHVRRCVFSFRLAINKTKP